jgi:hypothetical protein
MRRSLSADFSAQSDGQVIAINGDFIATEVRCCGQSIAAAKEGAKPPHLNHLIEAAQTRDKTSALNPHRVAMPRCVMAARAQKHRRAKVSCQRKSQPH